MINSKNNWKIRIETEHWLIKFCPYTAFFKQSTWYYCINIGTQYRYCCIHMVIHFHNIIRHVHAQTVVTLIVATL